MGTDPRRLDGLRSEERAAALLVEHATGATARAHDVAGRQGAYDIDLVHPDGRIAALEVTTHSGPARRDRDALEARASWPGAGRWWWTPGPDGPSHGPPMPVEVARPAGWSGEAPDPVGLSRAIDDLLDVPHVARRAAKVGAVTRVDERHLFIGLGTGALPTEHYLALTRSSAPFAGGSPDLPDGLTHLWLTTRWRSAPFFSWCCATGWRTHLARH